MHLKIIKRDGTEADFNITKIEAAIQKALYATGEVNIVDIDRIAFEVADAVLKKLRTSSSVYAVEDIQDEVEEALMKAGYSKTAKAYIVYRTERTNIRESNSSLMKALRTIVHTKSKDDDEKRSNANIDGDSSMGAMLQIGATASKEYYLTHLVAKEHAEKHKEGYIHIHDLDFYGLTTTCTQIDIVNLFKNGFSTGHGFLREPNSIGSYAALAAIAIQSNQNDQHGGQGIPNFDYGMALGVKKTYEKEFRIALCEIIETLTGDDHSESIIEMLNFMKSTNHYNVRLSAMSEEELDVMAFHLKFIIGHIIGGEHDFAAYIRQAENRACAKTERQTYQAMEGFVHNLNTMHSRAGAQVPFSSINYGTDTSPEGRTVIKNILMALEAGLGNGETPIFPIHIFKVKEGVNYHEDDPNCDLFKYSMKVSAKRLFPNYLLLDAPFNLQYYVPGRPETEVATMGCRTRVMANRCGSSTTFGRGNLSFTTVNLPRLAIESQSEERVFYEKLNEILETAKHQLLDRFEIQAKRTVQNYPFLMGQGVWLDSDKLNIDSAVREVIKHGTLSIGFIGLAEALTSLFGKHHGESEEAQKKGLEIVKYMRDFCDKAGEETGLNFSLLATPAEGLSGRFVNIDKKRYGTIPGVTDREYYTNSFHIPVWHRISMPGKIELEAPYHKLTNAGHITYVEVDGDISKNLPAFEAIIRYMHDCGIGYGSINHPVDRDPVCGYVGVIDNECPRCGRSAQNPGITVSRLNKLRKIHSGIPYYAGDDNRVIGTNSGIERIRRITGYLAGTLERFNDAKRAEERDRVKHNKC